MKIAALISVILSLVPDPGARSFVHEYLANRHGPIDTHSRIASATLKNGTVLAYVFGPQWCGATGGCTLLILKRRGSSYRLLGSKTPVKLPVYVLNTIKHGETNLGLIYAGDGHLFRGGLWSSEGIVSFDGHSYGGVGRLPDRFLPLGEREGREVIFWGTHDWYTLGEPL